METDLKGHPIEIRKSALGRSRPNVHGITERPEEKLMQLFDAKALCLSHPLSGSCSIGSGTTG